MATDPFRISRVTLRFADSQLEAAFRGEQAQKALRPLRIMLGVLALLVVSFYALTVHVFRGVIVGIGNQAMLSYAVGGALLCGLVYGASHTEAFRRHQQVIVAALVCVLWWGIVRSAGRLPVAVLEARGYTMALMFTFLVYSAFRLRFIPACACGWVGMAAYLAYTLGLNGASLASTGRSALLLSGANLFGMLIAWQIESATRREFAAMRQLDEERQRGERLLLNILPEPIAARLKQSGEAIAEHAEGVTVLFADIAGFTPLAATKSPQAIVALLNRVFTEFDQLALAHGLEKIKTIGDAYMAVAGLPVATDDHADRAVRLALDMLESVARTAAETGEALALRVGVHSGPVVAGVIGQRKFAYDLWGDTVNTASRMESHGVPGAIHCTDATRTLLHGAYTIEPRGVIDIKGKGRLETFLIRPD